MIDKQELLDALRDPDVVRLLHTVSDVDRGPKTQHHTLGRAINQASPGRHLHDDTDSAAFRFEDYTPVWTASGSAPAIGNGTLEARYAQIGKLVIVQFNFVVGSTTNLGAGTWRFSLPVNWSANTVPSTNAPSGNLRVARGGVGLARIVLDAAAGQDRFELQTAAPSWTATALGTGTGFYNPATPGAWVAGDSLMGTFYYEAA